MLLETFNKTDIELLTMTIFILMLIIIIIVKTIVMMVITIMFMKNLAAHNLRERVMQSKYRRRANQ